jgi:transposase InsO family protein
MALHNLKDKKQTGLIHHSDRGSQYCCGEYVQLLTRNHVRISMTENGDPWENAIAERINGILKTEWLYDYKPDSWKSMVAFIPEKSLICITIADRTKALGIWCRK